LLIEDDDNIRLALRLSLEDEGYSVVEAANGSLGLEAFAQATPDVVL
jgi:DNA-binding response OmpR family regulator